MIMLTKTNELTGPALDWAVAKCEGDEVRYEGGCIRPALSQFVDDDWYQPSTDWDQGGPIIEREKIDVARGNDIYFPSGNEKGDFYEPLWVASGKEIRQRIHGPTPLIAAMRCYVASKLGDIVDVPEELTK